MPRLPKLGFGDINDGSTEGYGIKRDRARLDFPLIGQANPIERQNRLGVRAPLRRRGLANDEASALAAHKLEFASAMHGALFAL